MRRFVQRWSVLLLLAVFVAVSCTVTPPPVVAVTSHVDGQTVLGSRAIQISGTVAAATAVAATRAGDEFTGIVSGGTFTVDVTLADDENAFEIAAMGRGGRATVELTLRYPFLALEAFPAATVVIGGSRTAADHSVSSTSVAGPFSNAAVDGGRLYLGDYGANRVLVYESVPAADGAEADLVLGQADFTSSGSGLGPAAFEAVAGLAAADGRLHVVDRGNHRVLVWSSPPTTNGAPADFAIGQGDLVSNLSGCARDRLRLPDGVAVAGGRLLVGDSGNRRVLVWNSLPTSGADLPDLVLGQPDFDTCASPDAGAFGHYLDVWTDGARVLVSDSTKNRVLLWNAFPTTDFAPPDVVLGQPDLTSTWGATTADGLMGPFGVGSNGNQVFVTDSNNHRLMVWDAFPTASGVPADRVVGQSNFTLGAGNDTDQDGAFGPGVSDRTFGYPYFNAIVDGALIVADYGNARYLLFR